MIITVVGNATASDAVLYLTNGNGKDFVKVINELETDREERPKVGSLKRAIVFSREFYFCVFLPKKNISINYCE